MAKQELIKPPGGDKLAPIMTLNSICKTRPALTTPMLLMASGIDHDPLPEAEVETCHVYRKGDKITALTPENLRDAADLGFKIFQLAAGPHFNEDIGPDGRGDWKRLDDNLDLLARFNLQALLMSGFYWMPPWMSGDPRAVTLRCREHNQIIPILSLWSPFTIQWIERCVAALAEHLRDRMNLIYACGVILYGDFGEALFPAGMLNVGSGHESSESGADLHSHSDFWCNDPCARDSYVDFLRRRYASQAESARWDPSDPNLFPVCPVEGQPARPWLDFLDWYHESMTSYAQRVVGIYRRHFPDKEIPIWLGGGVEFHTFGQDNTALPKAMKKFRASIRSTASACQQIARQLQVSSETIAGAFQRNYPLIKRIATACRFYKVPLWFEPPYPPGMDGPAVVSRIFESVSCGAAAYFEWTRTLQRQKATYEQFLDLLRRKEPHVDVAVYFPILSHRAKSGSLFPERFWNGAARLRALIDFDVVDDLLIRDGILNHYAVLVLPEIDLIERDVLDAIRRWVEQGGIAIAENGTQIRTPAEGETDEREWFGLSAPVKTRPGKNSTPVTAHEPWLALTPSRLNGQALDVFEEITPDAQTVLSQTTGAAVVRRSHGKGFSLLCASGSEKASLLISVIRDFFVHHPLTASTSLRVMAQWPDEEGRVFATLFGDHALLANLSSQPVTRQNGNQTVTLKPFDLLAVPFKVPGQAF